MNPILLKITRVLAVDPTSKGFGFAVLEGPDTLVDWGLRHPTGEPNRRCLELVTALVNRYQPDVLVVEHTGAKGSLRRSRACQLIENLVAMASSRRLRTQRCSRHKMQRCFSEIGSATKRQIAVALTQRFPELEICLPPVRKPWMSEDGRMGIFDAIAFGLTFFRPPRQQDGPVVALAASRL